MHMVVKGMLFLIAAGGAAGSCDGGGCHSSACAGNSRAV